MEPKYILDWSQLRVGDIVLTAESSVPSKGIRVATLGRYSHAAVWVGGTLIEATLEGVFSSNPQRLLADHPEHLAVYRSRDPLPAEAASRICEYARSQVGSLYALPEAMLMLFMRTLRMPDSRAQFCSRLVARAYVHAGVDLRNLRNPDFCSPRQLARCKAFVKVDDIVRQAGREEIEFAGTDDPIHKNLKDTYAWLNRVRALVSTNEALSVRYDIQSINDVSQLLLDHPELDDAVTGFMRGTDYLTFFDHDRTRNPHRYDRLLMWAEMRRRALDMPGFLRVEFAMQPDQASRHVRNIVATLHHVRQRRIGYFLEHLRLYRNLLEEIRTRAEVLAFGFKLVGDQAGEAEAVQCMAHAREYIMQADRVLGG